jgi:hypothetical protein
MFVSEYSEQGLMTGQTQSGYEDKYMYLTHDETIFLLESETDLCYIVFKTWREFYNIFL